MPGEGNDGQMTGRGLFLPPDLLRGVIAVHLRHLAVHQHGVADNFGDEIQSFQAVPCYLDLTPKLLQKFARHNLIDLKGVSISLSFLHTVMDGQDGTASRCGC